MLSKPPITDFPRFKREGRRIAALTACDYPIARLLDESGVDLILVGDSLGMVALGLPDTTGVTMDDMLHHTRAVLRGVTRTPVAVDLPAGSYDSPASTLENARRLMDAGANAVKLEGGATHAARIRHLTDHGIPVMAHIGMLPQSVKLEGGYHRKGRTEVEAEALMLDARAVAEAGAFAVVLEIIAAPVAAKITSEIPIPTIGIGSGENCDGQILVSHDLFGAFPWFTPNFITPQADVAGEIRKAIAAFLLSVHPDSN